MSEDAKRSLMIGAVLMVFCIALWLMFSGGGKPERGQEKKDPSVERESPASAESSSSPPAAVSDADRLLSGPNSAKPPPAPPPVKKTETGEPPPPRAKPTKFPEKFQPMRAAWRDQWNRKVEDKFQPEFSRTGDFYLAALQKLEDASLAKGDAAAALAVRDERKRWSAGREAPPPAAISSIPELAKLQQALAAKLTQLRADIKYDADKVKEDYLVALKSLERAMDDDDDKEGSKLAAEEFSRVTGMDDRAMAAYFNNP